MSTELTAAQALVLEYVNQTNLHPGTRSDMVKDFEVDSFVLQKDGYITGLSTVGEEALRSYYRARSRSTSYSLEEVTAQAVFYLTVPFEVCQSPEET